LSSTDQLIVFGVMVVAILSFFLPLVLLKGKREKEEEEERRKKEEEERIELCDATIHIRQESQLWKCTNCGAEMANARKFCTQCGTKRFISPVRPIECQNCNAPLDPKWDFCGDCGETIGMINPDEKPPSPNPISDPFVSQQTGQSSSATTPVATQSKEGRPSAFYALWFGVVGGVVALAVTQNPNLPAGQLPVLDGIVGFALWFFVSWGIIAAIRAMRGD